MDREIGENFSITQDGVLTMPGMYAGCGQFEEGNYGRSSSLYF